MDKKNVMKKLDDFISIQSLSSDPRYFHSMLEAAQFLVNELRSMDFDVEVIKHGNIPPLIIAQRVVDPKAKSIAIYGHYDIQPAEPLEPWNSDPFSLTVKNGVFYARGVADNKGHIILNLTAVQELISSGNLDKNIVFIFEGEEEVGSKNFDKLIEQKRDLFNDTEAFFVTDTDMFSANIPQMIYSLRGLIYFQLNIEIGNIDLHSGSYGNMAMNPISVLGYVASKMKNINTGEISIPEFYSDVREIPDYEQSLLDKTIVSKKDLIKETGLYSVQSVKKFDPSLVAKVLPSMDVNGIVGGHTGEGEKTVIPKKASMKFSFRLVEYQSAEKSVRQVKDFIKKIMPKGVKYELTNSSATEPFYTDIKNPVMKKTADIFNNFYKNDTIFNRCGASIPAAEIMQRLFKKPVVVTGFVLPDCKMHAPNENFDEDMFWKGIYAMQELIKHL